MRASTRVVLGIATCLMAAATACEELGLSGSCTLIGCRDEFVATITSADGSIPPGKHTLEIIADGATTSCTFQVPLAVGPGGGFSSPECPGIEVSIESVTHCTEGQTATAKFRSCTPIPGRFFEQIIVPGKSAQIRLRLSVDGATVVDQTEMPRYQINQPNGPKCEPVCHGAAASWMFATAMTSGRPQPDGG